MPNHPNRGRASNPAANPSPDAIRAAREAAGLTQREAGELVLASERSWQNWESAERRMHPATWVLARALMALAAGDELAALRVLSETTVST